MLSRSLRRSVLDIRIPISALPPTFLLPNRARYFNSTTQIIEPPLDGFDGPLDTPPTSKTTTASAPALTLKATISSASPSPSPSPAPAPARKPLSESVKELLPLLRAQASHYITAHIHAQPYLVTQGDLVRLPFKMPHVGPGDVLRLNRASVIGSRDYTLKGAPYLDESIFRCRATVLGTEGEPVRVLKKTKQRNRKVKTVRSKHRFTVLRISELSINALEDLGH